MLLKYVQDRRSCLRTYELATSITMGGLAHVRAGVEAGNEASK